MILFTVDELTPHFLPRNPASILREPLRRRCRRLGCNCQSDATRGAGLASGQPAYSMLLFRIDPTRIDSD